MSSSKKSISALLAVLAIVINVHTLLMAQMSYVTPEDPAMVQQDYLDKIYFCALPTVILLAVILLLQFNVTKKSADSTDSDT